MSTPPRTTRPILERSEPVRRWIDGLATGSASNAATEGGPVGETIAQAVDLGYRVLDEYLKQGQRAARGLGVRPERSEAAVDEMQDMAIRMARYTSDFLGVWAQFVDVAIGAGGLGRRNAPAPEESVATASNGTAPMAADGRTTIAVHVSSTRAVEVRVDVATSMLDHPLTVQDLRAAEATKAAIGGVSIVPPTSARPAIVRIVIPPGQPAGMYTGVVVESESGRFAGSIGVRIGEEPPGA